MKARPILFSGPMIRALLEGRKTQTRRIVKPQLTHDDSRPFSAVHMLDGYAVFDGGEVKCPYGIPGDLLWVRESLDAITGCDAEYAADGTRVGDAMGWDRWIGADYKLPLKAIPSIHMPRWASRLTLEITDVRVQRLQDISEEDARAEGITDGGCLNCGVSEPCGCSDPRPDARDAFAWLWHSIHGEESWHANPWVWCISFRVHRCNVDELLRQREAA